MSDRFITTETPLKGLTVIERQPIGDERGFFERLFCIKELEEFFPGLSPMQINHSLTAKRGAIRGMHFQHPPHAELKYVSCLRGEVYDVAVDIRENSPTFLQWHAEIWHPGIPRQSSNRLSWSS